MQLDQQLSELHTIARLIEGEIEAAIDLRRDGEPVSIALEAQSYAAGIAQLALALQPLMLEAIDLEQAAATRCALQ
mgnify:CR=1 FL=1